MHRLLRPRSLLAVALAATVAVSGCAESSVGPSTPTTTPRATGSIENEGSNRPGLEPNAVVERVVDGDTIIVDFDGTRERVRLLGIDTPESVAQNRPDQCYGEEASTYLKHLLPEGAQVTLIRDVEARDQYDRLLAYVVRSSDELFINLDLLEKGYAGILIYEPNSYYRHAFESAERAAINSGAGLWDACGGPDVPLD